MTKSRRTQRQKGKQRHKRLRPSDSRTGRDTEVICFNAQSTMTVISGQERDTEGEQIKTTDRLTEKDQ